MRVILLLVCASFLAPTTAWGTALGIEAVVPDALPLGGTAVVIVQVRTEDGAPAPGRRITIELVGAGPLGRGRTDRAGEAVIEVAVPGDVPVGPASVRVAAGDAEVNFETTVGARGDLLLTTDRSLYRPGQTVNLRVLALDGVSRIALAGEEVAFRIVDSRFDELLSETAVTDDLGVAAVTLPLDPEVQTGEYLATARAGGRETGVLLRVEDFRLPRFTVELTTTPAYLVPGGAIDAVVEVRYAHGAPVAGGTVQLTAATHARHPETEEAMEACLAWRAGGSADRQERWRICQWQDNVVEFAAARIDLDEHGRGAIRLEAPSYLDAVAELEEGVLEIATNIEDPGGHREDSAHTLPMASRALLVDMHWLHPPMTGVENRVAVTTQRPDGAPAPASISVEAPGGARVTAETGEDGIALVDLPLDGEGEVVCEATSGDVSARSVLTLYEWDLSSGLGLVIDRPVVRHGEPLELELRAGRPGGWVSLDAVVGGAVVARETVRCRQTRQRVVLDLPEHVCGLVSVVATRYGRAVQGSALVVREGRLSVEVAAAPERVRPGDDANLHVTVRDSNGLPAVAAVELGVVDHGIVALGGAALSGAESGFAVASQKDLSRLASAAAGDLDLTAALDDTGFQRRMAFWLPLRRVDMVLQPVEFDAPVPTAEPSAWVHRLARMAVALPGACAPPRFETWWRPLSIAVALALLGLLWRGRGEGRRIETAAAAATALTIAVIPWVRWAPGPSVEPVRVAGGETEAPIPQEWRSPRRYPGLPHGLFDPTLLPPRADGHRPDAGLIVALEDDGIRVEGQQIVTLDDFRAADEDLRGTMISPLYDHLQARSDDIRALREQYPDRRYSEVLVLIADDGAPFATLRQVMYTAGQAQWGMFTLTDADALRPVAPPAPDPRSRPLWFALIGIALVVLAGLHRAGPTSWAALVIVAGLGGLHALVRLYPLAADAGDGFPLQEGVAGVQLYALLGMAALAGVVAWRSRRAPPVEVSACLLVVGILGIGSTRDFGLYLDVAQHRPIELPAIGAPKSGGIDPFAEYDGAAGMPAADAGPGGVLVRSRFPDTLVYRPLLRTDERGQASISVPTGHQLTTWDASALASTAVGAMGLGATSMVTQQELQVELRAPARLTVGDRVEVPVTVYNHTDEPAEVRVSLHEQPGLHRRSPTEETLRIRAQSSAGTYLPVVATDPGEHSLRVHARSAHHADSVERTVEVWPGGGLPVDVSAGAFAASGDSESARLTRTASVLPDSSRVTLAVYPDLGASTEAGLRGLLQIPTGCCEQLISSTWPNLWLLGLARKGDLDEEAAERARDNALLGLQRIARCQRANGGFAYFPEGSADPWLTAYAVRLLSAMETQLGVGGGRAQRAARWLLWQLGEEPDIRRRAAICASLAVVQPGEPAVRQALVELTAAARSSDDPWFVVQVADAVRVFGERPADVRELLDRLESMGAVDTRGGTWWSCRETAAGARGKGAAVETTARVCSLLLAEGRIDAAAPGLAWLARAMVRDGRWTSTHDTAAAQQAFLDFHGVMPATDGSALPRVWIGGEEIPLAGLSPDDAGCYVVDISERQTAGPLELRLEAAGAPALALVQARSFVPWSAAGALVEDPSLSLAIRHSSDTVPVGRRAIVAVQVTDRVAEPRMLVVRLPVPPGLEVDVDDLRGIASSWDVDRAELDGAEVVVYLRSVGQQTVSFELPLVGAMPAEGQAQRAVVYDYYTPERRALASPRPLAVVGSTDEPVTTAADRTPGARVRTIPYQPEPGTWRTVPSRRWRTAEGRSSEVELMVQSDQPDRLGPMWHHLRVRNMGQGLAALIGTTGDGWSGQAVADLLADGSDLSGDLDAALATASGVRVARRGLASQVSAAEVKVHGTALTDAEVRRALERGHEVLRIAYVEVLAADPTVEGEVRLRFVVGEMGTADTIVVSRNSTGHDVLGAEARSWLEQRWFPLPPAGETVEVEVALAFGGE